jgi:beta-N-acetylhexosaminidase
MVPPARSIRVGAEASLYTRLIIGQHEGLTESAEAIEIAELFTTEITETAEKEEFSSVDSAGSVVNISVSSGSDQHSIIARMSMKDLRRHVGQLAIAGFAGHSIPQDLRLLAREFDLGGVVFFGRNVEAPEQVAEMSRDAQTLASELPLWVSTDQEGGRVARLKSPFTVWPPMMTLGRSGDERLAERFARALAAELRAVGISLDYTPVLDILTNRSNPVIGDRALAERADDVARLGVAIIRTLQAEGIAACGKHFPGHGDTSVDSHHALPVVDHPPDRIERVELVPFRAAVAADVACIMTAHILIPSIDDQRPATLSPRIISMVKQSLNFQGLVVTDDLEMKAISSKYGTAEASVAAIAAGCDAVLLCGTDQGAQIAALEAVIHAVEDGALPLKRVEDALARQRRVKERFLAPPRPLPLTGPALRTLLGRDEHQAIAAEMARFA